MPSANPVDEVSVIRQTAELDLKPSQRFILPKKKKYSPQYAHLYFCRLSAMRPHVLQSAKSTFGEPSDTLRYADRIVDAAANSDVPTVIIGVVFRQMDAKPSILAQYDVVSTDLIPAPPPRSLNSYVRDDDRLFIEDENGRCSLDISQLSNDDIPPFFVTGFVVAVKGVEEKTTGSFKVSAFASVGLAPQPSLPPLSADKYICLVSGFAFGHVNSNRLSQELFLEFIRGNIGSQQEVAASAQIVQLIVAGNLVPHINDTEHGAAAVLKSHAALKAGEKERAASPIVEVDRYLSALSSAIPVVVMPGEADPANHLMPQQPLHRCLLPSSSRNSNLARVPNPCEYSLDHRIVLGTSGQPVIDFDLYHKSCIKMEDGSPAEPTLPAGETVLDIMEVMLNGRHIAPTCPDTLGSYPFYQKDPFILDRTPHIFFSGNQAGFATRLTRSTLSQTQGTSAGSMQIDSEFGMEKSVRLISVPRFDETGQAVLVNLRTLECTVREFAMTM